MRFWFERASEVIAAALCLTLMVGLVATAEHRLSLRLPLETIEDQYAMSCAEASSVTHSQRR